MDEPMFRATWQAGVLSAASNILGQVITCYQSNKPLSIHYIGLGHFVLYTLLTTPLNFMWQSWLEAQFPGHTSNPGRKEKAPTMNETAAGTSTGIDRTKSSSNSSFVKTSSKTLSPAPGEKDLPNRLNLRNTAIKFALDQTFGASINTVMFLAGIPLFRGQSWAAIEDNVRQQFWPLTFAGQKVWPAVSILSFTLIPVQYRVVFGSAVGLFWGVYLSMMTSGSSE